MVGRSSLMNDGRYQERELTCRSSHICAFAQRPLFMHESKSRATAHPSACGLDALRRPRGCRADRRFPFNAVLLTPPLPVTGHPSQPQGLRRG